MPVKRTDADTRMPRNGLETGVRTAGAEHGFRRFKHPFAIANRIRPRRSLGIARPISHIVCRAPKMLVNGGALRILSLSAKSGTGLMVHPYSHIATGRHPI